MTLPEATEVGRWHVPIHELPRDVVAIADISVDFFKREEIIRPLIGFLHRASNIVGLNGLVLETWQPGLGRRMGVNVTHLMPLRAAYEQDPAAKATYREVKAVFGDFSGQFRRYIPGFILDFNI